MARAQAVLVINNHILLACHRRGNGCYWVLPGGEIEEHESPEEAAVREVREETGLDIQVVRLLFVDGPREESGISIKRPRYTFEAKAVGGSLRPIHELDAGSQENGHLAGSAWMPFQSSEYDGATRDTLDLVRAALGCPGDSAGR